MTNPSPTSFIAAILDKTKINLGRNPNESAYSCRVLEKVKGNKSTHKIQIRQEVVGPRRIEHVTVQSLELKFEKSDLTSAAILDLEGGIFTSTQTQSTNNVVNHFLDIALVKVWEMRGDFADAPRGTYLKKHAVKA